MVTSSTQDDAPATANLIDGAPVLAARDLIESEKGVPIDEDKDKDEPARSIRKGDSSETETIVDDKVRAKPGKLDDAHVIPKNNLVSFVPLA